MKRVRIYAARAVLALLVAALVVWLCLEQVTLQNPLWPIAGRRPVLIAFLAWAVLWAAAVIGVVAAIAGLIREASRDPEDPTS